MALPPRDRHELRVRLSTSAPLSAPRLESLVAIAIATEVARASVSSPVRDVQDLEVELVRTTKLESAQ